MKLNAVTVGLDPFLNQPCVMISHVVEDHQDLALGIVYQALQEAQEGLGVETICEGEAEPRIVTQAESSEHFGRASDRLA